MIRLRELREARHMSQVRLAMELNVTQAVISKYELGKSDPDIRMLCSIADLFGVSVDFLIGLSGPAYLAAIYFADLFKNYEDVEEETVK